LNKETTMQISPPPGAETMLLRSIENAVRAAYLYGVRPEAVSDAVVAARDVLPPPRETLGQQAARLLHERATDRIAAGLPIGDD
jgi:hypothetical protein